jgi:hypothetical protein
LKIIDGEVVHVEEEVTEVMSMKIDGGFAEEEDGGDCDDPKVLGEYFESDVNFSIALRRLIWWM